MNAFLDYVRGIVLRFLRVPHDPHPPAGSEGSLRVFRAGKNLFRLQRWLWGVRQLMVFAGLAFGFWVVHALLSDDPRIEKLGPLGHWLTDHRDDFERWHVMGWFLLFKAFGFATALGNLFVSYVVMKLRYDLHWYMVTDRSLRIRDGVTRVREMTLSFANIQQIVVRQGPLQRLLGLADVVVTTAGGGGSGTQVAHAQPMAGAALGHMGVLASVDNAESIRDLMLERLRRLKSSGLGDPDDHHESHGTWAAGGGTDLATRTVDSLAAARDVLQAVRELRAAVETPRPG